MVRAISRKLARRVSLLRPPLEAFICLSLIFEPIFGASLIWNLRKRDCLFWETNERVAYKSRQLVSSGPINTIVFHRNLQDNCSLQTRSFRPIFSPIERPLEGCTLLGVGPFCVTQINQCAPAIGLVLLVCFVQTISAAQKLAMKWRTKRRQMASAQTGRQTSREESSQREGASKYNGANCGGECAVPVHCPQSSSLLFRGDERQQLLAADRVASCQPPRCKSPASQPPRPPPPRRPEIERDGLQSVVGACVCVHPSGQMEE